MSGAEATRAGPPAKTAVEQPPATAAPGPARWDVATLCGDTGEAILVHKGEHYRLRVTSRGRLILTK